MKAYRVTYPLITSDASRDFMTREEAEAFARGRRDICEQSPYMTSQCWRMVRVEEIENNTSCNCQGPPNDTTLCVYCQTRMREERRAESGD